MNKVKSVIVALVTILVISFIPFVGAVRTSQVKSGEVAVQSTLGKVSGIKEPGLSLTPRWFTKLTTFKVTQDKLEETYAVSTKDMQTVDISVALQYTVIKESVTDLYIKFGGNYVDSIVKPKLAEAVNSVIAGYTIEEVVSERVAIADAINTRVLEELDTYGILVVSSDITDHDFNDEYEAAVTAKKVAEQATLTAKEADKVQVNKAQSDLEVAEITAQKEIVAAEGKAEANHILQASLSEAVLRDSTIKKWDGVLPKSSNGGYILETVTGE